jgi:hypothetical protein
VWERCMCVLCVCVCGGGSEMEGAEFCVTEECVLVAFAGCRLVLVLLCLFPYFLFSYFPLPSFPFSSLLAVALVFSSN